jgi:uncharacterized tellurite resistance protein B-like protein
MTRINELFERARRLFASDDTVDRLDYEHDKQLLESLSETDEIGLSEAYAFLLVDLAMIDNQFHANEQVYLTEKLKKEFAISDAEVGELIIRCRAMISALRGSFSYVEFLNKTLSGEQKKHLMKLVRGMIEADGKLDEFETYLQNRFAKVLGTN